MNTWMMKTSDDKQEVISKLKKDGVITETGGVDYQLLHENYDAAVIYDFGITYYDIWKTLPVDVLFSQAIAYVEELRIDLLRGRVYVDDAKELVRLMELIIKKQEEGLNNEKSDD